jgi:hypothetical protein
VACCWDEISTNIVKEERHGWLCGDVPVSRCMALARQWKGREGRRKEGRGNKQNSKRRKERTEFKHVILPTHQQSGRKEGEINLKK